jgi:PAS domain S-box-containing protein
VYWQLSLYALVLGMATLVSATLAFYAWRRHRVPGAMPLTVFMLAAAVWCLGYALELISPQLTSKILWSKIQYLGIVAVAPAMLTLAVQYAGRGRWLTLRNLVLLAVVPVTILLLVWTNEFHGLIWAEVGLDDSGPTVTLALVHGPFFWVLIVYSYLCLLGGTLLLLQMFRQVQRFYRGQVAIILAGTLVPWVGNLLYITGLVPLPNLDLTPFAFVISGVIGALGLFRTGLLRIVPVARSRVVETLGGAVIVLDPRSRVVDANQVAEQMLERPAREMIGLSAERVLPTWLTVQNGELASLVKGEPGDGVEMQSRMVAGHGDERCFFDVRVSPLRDRRGVLAGHVLVIHDTTSLHWTELALRESQDQLEAQNAELRRLHQAMEQSANAVIITNLEGNIEYVNPRFEESSGYTAKEVLGQNPRILKSGQQDEVFYQEMWETISSGQAWQGEFCNKRKDGSLYWELASIAPIYDDSGRMTHYVAVKEEITARKQVQDALTRLLHLSQSLAGTHDMEDALATVVDTALEVVPAASQCTLQWLDSDGQTLRTIGFGGAGEKPRKVAPFRMGQGVAGYALGNREIVNVPDVEIDERFAPTESGSQFRSLLVVPLIVQDRPLGTLSFNGEEVGAFSANDEALAGLVADQVAAALQSAEELTARREAEEALRRSTERLRLLHEIDQSIQAAGLPETVAVAAIGRVRRLIMCQRALVLALQEDGRVELLAAESDAGTALPGDIELYGELFDQQVLHRGLVYGFADLDAQERRSPLQEALHDAGVRSYVVVPLMMSGELIGTLNLESRQVRAFSAGHVEIASEVAASLAVAMRQARLYSQAQQELAERVAAEEALRIRERFLTLLNSMTRTALEMPDLPLVLQSLVGQLGRLFGADACCLTLWDETKGRISHSVAQGSEGEAWRLLETEPPETNPIVLALNTGRPLVVEAVDTAPFLSLEFAEAFPHRSLLALPLVAGEQKLGAALVAFATKHAFSPSELRHGVQVAAQIALAVAKAQLVEALQDNVLELEARNEELNSFAHTVAHDLKNPLYVVVGYASLLSNERAKLTNEMMQSFLDKMVRHGFKMRTIIDELLLLATVRGTEEVSLEPLDMGQIVREVRERLRRDLEEGLCEIVQPENWPVAIGYGPWIEEVWVNYVSNAVKYGGQPPRVELGYTMVDGPPDGREEENGNGWVRFWVRDNGPGLSVEEQSRLFTPFERLHEMRAEGHGLGLSIVQRIVQKLGGQVGVESEGQPGQGSMFYFVLPVAPDDAP